MVLVRSRLESYGTFGGTTDSQQNSYSEATCSRTFGIAQLIRFRPRVSGHWSNSHQPPRTRSYTKREFQVFLCVLSAPPGGELPYGLYPMASRLNELLQ